MQEKSQQAAKHRIKTSQVRTLPILKQTIMLIINSDIATLLKDPFTPIDSMTESLEYPSKMTGHFPVGWISQLSLIKCKSELCAVVSALNWHVLTSNGGIKASIWHYNNAWFSIADISITVFSPIKWNQIEHSIMRIHGGVGNQLERWAPSTILPKP